mmetsp:Transcript_92126/g.177608  ORF Transcript_92126/g.177608 Transcript_92126/m.177608 type:complete len:84 (+) Transcript_92126:79-330(+)
MASESPVGATCTADDSSSASAAEKIVALGRDIQLQGEQMVQHQIMICDFQAVLKRINTANAKLRTEHATLTEILALTGDQQGR